MKHVFLTNKLDYSFGRLISLIGLVIVYDSLCLNMMCLQNSNKGNVIVPCIYLRQSNQINTIGRKVLFVLFSMATVALLVSTGHLLIYPFYAND